MGRWRSVLGLITGGFLALSGFAHMFLGGAAMRDEMAKAHVPPDLAQGLIAGWNLGGAFMFSFSAIAVWTFLQGLRGRSVTTVPARIMGVSYVFYAAWGLLFTAGDPFFLVFLIPGVALVVATSGPSSAR